MESLFSPLQDLFLTHGFDKTYWVAYSGGLDSHVLLHALAQLRSDQPLRLRAIYVNHCLSPNASQWAQHCATVCESLQIDFQEEVIDANAAIGQSPEEVARQSRYSIFSKLISAGDILLTAHHQNDQAETLLLQMLRGAGPKGLAAMPSLKVFAKGFHARPWLNLTREELQEYAEQHHLRWIEDESNTNTAFSRNFIRHEVLPILKKRWPTVTETLTRVAHHCAESQQLLDQFMQQDLERVKGLLPRSLSIKKLVALDDARQRQVLRGWLQELGFPIPQTTKILQIQRDMLYAREDKMPHFCWSGVELRRFRDHLCAMPALQEFDAAQVFKWDFSQPLVLPQVGCLHATPVLGQGLRADSEHVTVRFRQGGESCRLPGREQHHDLKKLFQEWGVPTWERERLPLIYVGKKLAAVVGFFVSDEFAAGREEQGYVFSQS